MYAVPAVRGPAAERIGGSDVELQPQLANYLGTHQRQPGSRGGHAKPLEQFLRDARSTDPVGAFEHDNAQSRARQISRAHKTVVPRSYHYGVVGRHRSNLPRAVRVTQ